MRFVRTAENLFGLPAGFQRVEYLQSSGAQYIDSGVNTDSNLGFDVGFKWDTFNTANSRFLGVIKQDGSNYIRHHSSDSGSSFGYFVSNNATVIQGTATTAFHTFKYDSISKKFNYDGTDILAVTPAIFNAELNYWIFGRNSNVESLKSYASVKIYQVKLYNGSTLVRDFIPCIDQLGVACMYDLVGKKPYYNQGAGTFTVGRQIIPVEYLESTGTQYINTGIKGNLNTKIETKVYSSRIGLDPGYCIAGDFTTSTKAITMPFNFISDALYSRFGNKSITTGIQQGNGTYTFSVDKEGYYVDGVKIANFNTTTSFTTDGTIMLFGFTGLGRSYLVGKMYHCTIWDNGVLTRDFIPCKDENNVGFMFDTLSGTVYLNSGTGSFTVGENKYTSKLRLIKDAIRIPDGYTRVEYLESTGTQYIDTGVNLTSNHSVEIDYQLTSASQNRKGIFGGLVASGPRFGTLLSPSNNYLEFGYGSSNVFYQPGLPDTKRHIMKQQKNLLYFDGVLIYTFNTATFTQSFTAPLGNFAYTNYNPASAKYYSSKWWDNDTLVRSFIPVRDSNNVGYMFDEVTGQLFGNAGSGSFGIGNDLPTAKVRFIQDVLPREYRPLKYLESTGTQFIDTGFIPTDDNFKFEGTLFSQSTSAYFGYRSTQVASADGDMRWFFNFNDGRVAIRYGSGGINSTLTFNTQIKHNFYFDGNSLYIDGVNFLTISQKYSTPVYKSFYLFSVNTNGYYGSDIIKFIGKIYNWKIWDGNTLVRDFYPALRKSDNKPGMYDRITKQFFTNQGTGEFNYG